ncbi:hypothetical protein DFH09DRAFT_1314139 [Mycena vulgaris]|nr:hypothetical protein DFH09DRAFT_1314139 [Mycena vulgaris]
MSSQPSSAPAPSTETSASVSAAVAAPRSAFSPFRLLSSAASLAGFRQANVPAPAPVAAAAAPMLTAPALPNPVLPAPVLPAPVLPFLQVTAPWIVGVVYSVVPTQLLTSIPVHDEELWYTILRGKYVGITQNHALALDTVVGILNNSMKSYKTQDLAVGAFNGALHVGLVQIRPY